MKTLHVEISGKVQGVFFRATAKEIADDNKITGWIKNTKDGKVVALISGEEDDLEKFILWCKNGPKKAKVSDVVSTENAFQSFNKFEVLR